MDFYEREKYAWYFPLSNTECGHLVFFTLPNTEVRLLVIFPYLILKVCFSKIIQKGVRYWSMVMA